MIKEIEYNKKNVLNIQEEIELFKRYLDLTEEENQELL
jgi:hypothetical protein